MTEEINKTNRSTCPRCEGRTLRNWSELDAEEQEVVRRIPSQGGYSLEERQRTHRWCTRCWLELSGDEEALV